MPRARGDIDPRKLDVVKRKRGRKDRSKPDPKPFLKDGEEAATERAMERPASPGVMLEPKGEGWKVTSPHSDANLWELQLADAFGTRSHTVMTVFLRDLRKLCRKDYDEDLQRWKRDETELNAALAMVNDWQPENTAQAALAAQMVAVHWMVMRLSAQALNNGHMVMETDAALAGKLSGRFAQLCETMQLLKGKQRTAKQAISVTRESHHHQHIHVYRDTGSKENHAQPQDARAATIEGRAALSGPREVHEAVVPLRRDEGQEGLPEARRGQSRRSQGGG